MNQSAPPEPLHDDSHGDDFQDELLDEFADEASWEAMDGDDFERFAADLFESPDATEAHPGSLVSSASRSAPRPLPADLSDFDFGGDADGYDDFGTDDELPDLKWG